MKYPTLKFVFDRKHLATKKTKGLVQIEVLSERKRKWIGTGVKLFSDQWDDRAMVINDPDMLATNKRLLEQRQRIQSWVDELARRGEEFEFDKLERFLETRVTGERFTDYIEVRIEERNDICEATKKSHRKLKNSLAEFGKIIYFTDLTKKNIMAYDQWLRERGLAQSTIHSFHKYMKIYINDAIRAEIIDSNPYVGFKIDRGHSAQRKYLSESELQAVVSAEIPVKTVARARDLFVFQCYTGFAYADLAKFDFSKVEQRNGRYVISDSRQKTDEVYFVVLLSPAVEILKRYDFKLPIISLQQYNSRLKLVADYAKLERDITSHMGRHTFATMALNRGAKIENVSKMLGHTDIATTQIYAKVLNTEVERDFAMLEKSLTPKKPRKKKK